MCLCVCDVLRAPRPWIRLAVMCTRVGALQRGGYRAASDLSCVALHRSTHLVPGTNQVRNGQRQAHARCSQGLRNRALKGQPRLVDVSRYQDCDAVLALLRRFASSSPHRGAFGGFRTTSDSWHNLRQPIPQLSSYILARVTRPAQEDLPIQDNKRPRPHKSHPTDCPESQLRAGPQRSSVGRAEGREPSINVGHTTVVAGTDLRLLAFVGGSSATQRQMTLNS